MGGISISSTTKLKKTQRLVSNMASYLFEEQYGECKYLKDTTINNMRTLIRSLQRAINKN